MDRAVGLRTSAKQSPWIRAHMFARLPDVRPQELIRELKKAAFDRIIL